MKKKLVLFIMSMMCTNFVLNNSIVSMKKIVDEQVPLHKQVTNNYCEYTFSSVSDVTEEVYVLNTEQLLATVNNNNNFDDDSYLLWSGWSNLSKNINFTGKIKTKYLNNSVYMSMKLPSEVTTAMTFRKNAAIMEYQPIGYDNLVGIGAIYPVLGVNLPNEINVYLGKINTYVLMKGDNQWREFDSFNPKEGIYHYRLFELPWTTEKSFDIPSSASEVGEDYVKFTLSRNDLEKNVIHFWGNKKICTASNIVGVVVVYEVWSDTPGIEGKLAATIGIDQKKDNGQTVQGFSGRNYAVTNTKRYIIGHNMPDDVYDWCVSNGISPEVCVEMYSK